MALPNTSLDAEGNLPYQARSPRKQTYVIKKHSAFSPSFLSSDKRNKKEIFLSLTSTSQQSTRKQGRLPRAQRDTRIPLIPFQYNPDLAFSDHKSSSDDNGSRELHILRASRSKERARTAGGESKSSASLGKRR